MLQKLNERIQGVVAWLVIILIAITFTLFGVDYYLQSHQTSDAKIVVNDQPISNHAFETSYRRARAQQDIAHMTSADEKNLQDQVLNQLVTNEVSVQSARKNGFEVTVNEANSAILNIPQFQEDGHFSTEKYQQALNGALYTPETFQNEVRQGMLLNQQRFAFMGSSFALPAEIKRFVRLYMQTRDYDYITIPFSKFEKEVQLTSTQIKEYYTTHMQEFMTPEQVSIDYIVLSMPDIKAQTKISNDEVKKYYEENQTNFLTPAQWHVAHILLAIPDNASKEEEQQIQKKAEDTYAILEKNPEQFDSLVASLSDDKLSLADKGVLPWIIAGQNQYYKNLTNLTNPGQISAPEKTKYGFELFKLINYKPVSTQPLAAVENTIKEQLASDKAQTTYTQTLEKLSDLSYQTPDTLTPVADALALKIQQSQPFSRLGGNDVLTKNKQIINAAFSHDVLALNNNSEPVQLNNDSVVVLRVNKHSIAQKQTLVEAQKEISQILTKKQAEDKAKEIGTLLLNPIENKQQQDLIAANQLQWQQIVKASRDSDKANTVINDLAFNLLRTDNREGISLDNGDYAVVRLKSINDGQLNTLDQEQKNSLVQQIESNYGMMDYDLYINNLIHEAKVVRQ